MRKPQWRAMRRQLDAIGIEIRHDLLGFYICTREEGEHEDDGNASVGFDGRPHFFQQKEAVKNAWATHCEAA